MNPSTHILLTMIRADLELAYEHLENGCFDLALHELNNAKDKILQAQAVQPLSLTQPTLLTPSTPSLLVLADDPCGSHPPINEQSNGADTTDLRRET